MKDLLKIISAKSLNIIAKKNKEDIDQLLESEEKIDSEKDWEDEEVIRQEDKEIEDIHTPDVINEDISDKVITEKDMTNIESENTDSPEKADLVFKEYSERDTLEDALDAIDKDRQEKERKDSHKKTTFRDEEEVDEDSQFTQDAQEKRLKETIRSTEDLVDLSQTTEADRDYTPKPGDEERDAIRRLKVLKQRILKRLKTAEEAGKESRTDDSEEGDTNE